MQFFKRKVDFSDQRQYKNQEKTANRLLKDGNCTCRGWRFYSRDEDFFMYFCAMYSIGSSAAKSMAVQTNTARIPAR